MSHPNITTLGQLLRRLPESSYQYHGTLGLPIQQIAWDHTKVSSQCLYFCLEEEEFQESYFHKNSLDHWAEAVKAGATCIVCERGKIREVPPHVSLLEVDQVNEAMAWIAREFYDDPFNEMNVIGVTGTNGKTTTTQLLYSIFEKSGRKVGVIGTIGILYPSKMEPEASLSNPLAIELQKIGYQMREEEVENIFMEMTSHAGAFHRNISIDARVLIFTNLTQDHLDYHKTFDAYKASKLKHFERLGKMGRPAAAVVNIDDISGLEFLQAIDPELKSSGQVETITYGIRNKEADLLAYPLEITGKSSRFNLVYRGDPQGTVELPMAGLFNIYNALGSLGAAYVMGVPFEIAIRGLKKARQVSGRFEQVDCNTDFNIYVDYAHTPDALLNILQSVKEITSKRLFVIFGCGGDRDRSKRPLMGEAAVNHADFCILTSDNPRTEDPEKILHEIKGGMGEFPAGFLEVIENREQAIHRALELAEAGDSVLIAGKGHESYQIYGQVKHPFSDRESVYRFFEKQENVEKL